MIAGIDLNSRAVAICVTNGNGHWMGVHKVPARIKDRAQILGELYGFMMLTPLIQPGMKVYVEAPIVAGARNIQSTIKVAAAYGCVLAALDARHAVVAEVAVSTWKLATVGRGNASKLDVSDWLHTTHPSVHRECSGDQDLMDASCIALYGRRSETTGGGRDHVLHQAP